MKENHFDVAVIGSGPGGYVCAIRCAQLGFKTAIVEKYSTLGGTCLNVGCIPSKALLDSSERYFEATHSFSDHGIGIKKIDLDFKKMVDRVKGVVKTTCSGIDYLMDKNKISTFTGVGSFVDAHTLEIKGEKNESITADRFVIATGSKPNFFPGMEYDKKRVISSTEALYLDEVPKHMVVIGGGVIGLELGSVYKRLGSKVSVVEFANSLIPGMDSELGKHLQRRLKKDKMEFYMGHQVLSTKGNKNKAVVVAKNLKSEEEISIECDYCLVAVGRKAYTDGLNLAAINLQVDDRGRVPTNEHKQTTHAHIYAIGDVTEGIMLAHKAEEEGVFVAEHMAGQKPHLNYNLIPSVVYTWPEVASVGATEDALKKSGVKFNKGSFPFKALGRARASNESDGFIKVLADSKTDEILGIHMYGPRAADLIAEAVVAMEFRASAEDIARSCHPHPTYSEALKEACLAATENRAIHI